MIALSARSEATVETARTAGTASALHEDHDP